MEVPTFKFSLKITDFLYFGLSPKKDAKGNLVPISTADLVTFLKSSPFGKEFEFHETSGPRLSRNSPSSDRGTVWFDVHDSRGGLTFRNLVGKPFMYGKHRLVIAAADKRVSVPQCTRCWRFGHRSDVWACPFKSCYCPICNSHHTIEFHRALAACCRGNPHAKGPKGVAQPIPPTPEGEECSHEARCVNCGRDHRADDRKCSYWKLRFDPKWIYNRYKDNKVSDAVWQFQHPINSAPARTGAVHV